MFHCISKLSHDHSNDLSVHESRQYKLGHLKDAKSSKCTDRLICIRRTSPIHNAVLTDIARRHAVQALVSYIIVTITIQLRVGESTSSEDVQVSGQNLRRELCAVLHCIVVVDVATFFLLRSFQCLSCLSCLVC